MSEDDVYVRMVEYRVRPGAEARFERVYGPSGKWVVLFRRGAGFTGTELLRSTVESDRYLTIDRWVSATAWEAFRATLGHAYDRLNEECAELKLAETDLGAYVRAPR